MPHVKVGPCKDLAEKLVSLFNGSATLADQGAHLVRQMFPDDEEDWPPAVAARHTAVTAEVAQLVDHGVCT